MSLHHEIEGDILLFEYADKDIELVCGSLVTIRQGTLQVVHLTVKEFLISAHGPSDSTYSDLLIDPAQASFHLTLACLKCIKYDCNKSFVDLDPRIARLDIKLGDDAVPQRQRQAPLVEYACLTWMVHLTDCDGAQMIGVSKALQETFDSPSTFYWVEACMTFQPDSVLRLLVGLEEAIEYISGLCPNDWPENETSCVFFANWCHALRDILEQYGSILFHRPWEVHFLDLQTSFPDSRQLHENFGDLSRRDITLRIDGYKSPRSCRPRAQAQNRLQQDVQGSLGSDSSIFFIHDARRRQYFWGFDRTNLNNVWLFVQNAITGQRLPPAVKLDGEAGRRGKVSSYGLSPSGKHIVVVYQIDSANYKPADAHSLTLIWEVDEDIRFKGRMRSEPWARVVFNHGCEIGLFSTHSTSIIVFLDDEYYLTPSGEIHLASGSRRPLPDYVSDRFASGELSIEDLFFSQNGEYIFVSEWTHDGINSGYRAIRIALHTHCSEFICLWKEASWRLADVSPSGRFLVLSESGLPGRGDEFPHLHDVHLHNVNTGDTVHLPLVERLDFWEAKYHFMKNETELVVFIWCWIHGIGTMNVLVWSNLQLQPFLRTSGRLNLDDIVSPQQIHVNDDESSALIITGDRAIQRVEFRSQVTFPDAPDVNDDYPCNISQISKDGRRWASLRYGQSKAQLQMADVSAAKIQIRRIDLELSPWDEPQSRAASFSSDLYMLVVDAQVFTIGDEANGLTSASFTIHGLLELLVTYRTKLSPRHYCQLRCLISPCNSYVLFISPGDIFSRKTSPSTIYAFRIDHVSKSSIRLDLSLPKEMLYISANFHPSQRVMLLTYSSSPESGVQQLRETPPLLQVSSVELEDLEMKPIVLPQGESFAKRVKE